MSNACAETVDEVKDQESIEKNAVAEADERAAAALEFHNVWFSYFPKQPLLKGLNLEIPPRQITMLVGASGSGKTSVLKLAKGLLTPQRGSIKVFGERLMAPRNPQTARLDRRVAYIPQQLGLVRNLTALENTLTGALGRVSALSSLFKRFPAVIVEQAHQTLADVGLAHKASEQAFHLSGGERQRVAIARALMQQPRLILADEFVSQLDAATAAEVLAIITATVGRGVTLLMTTHHLELVNRYADALILMRAGEVALACGGGEARVEEMARLMR